MYQYDDIALSIVKDLNTRILNLSFLKLAKNDASILPVNDYIPKIWENKWFNDNAIAGYSKGDVVWKYTMTSSEFLSNYNQLIYDYANDNLLLCGYFKYNRGEYYETEQETLRYLNVISGYGVAEPELDISGNIQHDKDGNVITYWDQKLPMLFDYGQLNTAAPQAIQIYVSLLDDNKKFLSDSQAWTNIVLSSDESFNQYISTEISILIENHVKNYHLDGAKTNKEFSDILLKRDFSNFDVSALYNAQRMIDHDKYINDQGFDYVREFKKSSISTSLDGNYKLYKWCRLWNSGHLEHGGIIEIPKYDEISSSNASCYIVSIDFTWANSDRLYYDYSISDDFYGNTTNNLYFANGVRIENYKLSSALKINNRYAISLTPIQFNENDFNKNSNLLSLKSEDIITSTSYPQNSNNDLNKTYVNFETHSITNKSFCITRSRTDDLCDNNTIRYIQYYVSGYRTSVKRSYNMLKCYVKQLEDFYNYTGDPIEPNIEVYSNDNELLSENINYHLTYHNNINATTNDARIEIIGISPFYGTLVVTFGIKYELTSSRYLITNIETSYKFT